MKPDRKINRNFENNVKQVLTYPLVDRYCVFFPPEVRWTKDFPGYARSGIHCFSFFLNYEIIIIILLCYNYYYSVTGRQEGIYFTF